MGPTPGACWIGPMAPDTLHHFIKQKLATRMPGSRFLARGRGALAPVATALLLAGACFAALLLVVALLEREALAAPLAPAGEDWEGLSQLIRTAQGELGQARVVVTRTLDLGDLRRADALLIIHPEHALDAEELTLFMRSGGRIVLLDDYGAGDGVLAHFHIRRVPLPDRPAAMLRSNPAFAIAEPASTSLVVRDVTRVVTNHATGLEQPSLQPVLVVHGDDEPDVLLAVAGVVGQGRLVVLGDSSVLMNAMLRYPGNRTLSVNLLRYATEDDAWGRLDGKLYVLVNDFDLTGAYGVDPGLGGIVARTQRAASEGLEVLRHGGMPPAATHVLALLVGLGVVAWTSVRAGKTHRPSPPRFARAVPVVAHGGVAGRAATLSAPGSPRFLAMLELKSALEESLTARLGLERTPSRDELVAKVRAARLLDDDGARALSRLLETLGLFEAMLVAKRRSPLERVRDAEVMEAAARVRDLLAAAADPQPRDRVEVGQ